MGNPDARLSFVTHAVLFCFLLGTVQAKGGKACSANSECGTDVQGSCVNNYCECTGPWTGDDCTTAFSVALGPTFFVFAYGTWLLFFVVGASTAFILLRVVIATGCTPSTQKVALAFILLGSSARLLYFSLDPWQRYGYMYFPVNNAIWGFAMPCFFTAYYLIVLQWIYVLTKTSGQLQAFPNAILCPFLVSMTTMFCLEGIARILWFVSPEFGTFSYLIVIVYYLVLVLVLGILFCIFGSALSCRLYRSRRRSKRKGFDRMLCKTSCFTCSTVTVSVCCVLFMIVVAVSGALEYPVTTLFTHAFIHCFELVLAGTVCVVFRGNMKRAPKYRGRADAVDLEVDVKSPTPKEMTDPASVKEGEIEGDPHPVNVQEQRKSLVSAVDDADSRENVERISSIPSSDRRKSVRKNTSRTSLLHTASEKAASDIDAGQSEQSSPEQKSKWRKTLRNFFNKETDDDTSPQGPRGIAISRGDIIADALRHQEGL